MAVISKPTFPNVPNLSGVPQLKRSLSSPADAAPVAGIAVALGRLWQALTAQPTWGIFKRIQKRTGVTGTVNGITVEATEAQDITVVEADSVLDFGYRSETSISDFPVQDGDFATYNKVSNPYEASVRLIKGSSESARRQFLDQIETMLNSRDLVYILTPERTYTNVNPYRVEVVRRGAAGAFQLTEVDVFFREVRTVTAAYSTTAVTTLNAKSASAQPAQNNGSVAAETPTTEPTLNGVVNQ